MTISLTSLQNAAALLWIFMFPILLIGVFFLTRKGNEYSGYLRNSFPNLWCAVGNDELASGELRSQASLLLFLLKREYRKVENFELGRRSEKLRRTLVFYFIACFIYFALTLILFL